DFLHAHSQWFRWTLFFSASTAIGAFTGILILWRRRNRYAFPAAVFPMVFPIAYYLTLAPPRYRHPMDPVLALLSAVSFEAICQTIGRSSIGSSRIIDNK